MQDERPPPELAHEADLTLLPAKLRTAARELSDRGLNAAAKWCSELLVALPPPTTTPAHFRTSTPVRHPPSTRQSLPGLPPMSSIARVGARDSLGSVMEMEGSSPALGGQERMQDEEEEGGEWAPDAEAKREEQRRNDEEQDLYTLALSYYRVHELLRASYTLRDCTGPRARWLRTYTKFLVSCLLSARFGPGLGGYTDSTDCTLWWSRAQRAGERRDARA